MASAVVIPILWTDVLNKCIQGSVDVSTADFPETEEAKAIVQDLIDVLNDKFERLAMSAPKLIVRHVDFISLYGTRLRPNRSLASIMMAFSAGSPRLLATTAPHSTGIYVLTGTGQKLFLNGCLTDSLDNFKSKIYDKLGIPVDEQRLIFGYQQLEDGWTLADYKVTDKCTVHLVLRMSGGGGGFAPGTRFADISKDSLCGEENFTKSAPRWRVVHKGLNLEGRCENSTCKAFDKWIIHPNGYITFNLLRDGLIKCPQCYAKVKPLTCGFYDCVWKYEGVRSDDQCHLSSPWRMHWVRSIVVLIPTSPTVQSNGLVY